MAEDNWQHRSAKMKCSTCMWFVAKTRLVGVSNTTLSANGEEIYSVPSDLGRCRRKAPTMGGWPAVFSTDWCGSHKLDENKI